MSIEATYKSADKIRFKSDKNNTFEKFYSKKQKYLNTSKDTKDILVKQNNLNKKSNKAEEDYYLKAPWPRWNAYANEVGEAVRPSLGSKIANTFWIPALVYCGMDIHDKYKKGEDGKKNSKTALRRAIFHGAASLIGPTLALKAGQHLAVTQGFGENFKHGIGNTWAVKIADKLADKSSSLFKKVNEFPLIGKKLIEWFGNNNLPKKPVLEEASNFFTKWLVKRPLGEKIVSGFAKRANKSALKEIAEMAEKGLNTVSKTKLSNTFKTIVGFITLALVAIPIDKFTEKFIIKKVVNPSLGLKDE